MKKWLVLVITVVLLTSGCSVLRRPSIPSSLPPPAQDALVKIGIIPFIMIGGIVLGVFAFINGNKFGIPAVMACIVGLVLSIAILKYAWYIALIGAIGLTAAIITFSWSFFNNQKGIVLTTAKKLNDSK